MHMPERCGYVQFSGITAGTGTDAFVEDPNERVKWGLRRLYYRQRRLRAERQSDGGNNLLRLSRSLKGGC